MAQVSPLPSSVMGGDSVHSMKPRVHSMKVKKHKDFDNYLIDENGDIYSKIGGYDNGTGYRLYKLKKNNGETMQILGHRITWEAWNEEDIQDGYEIHHKNFERSDNHIDNLDHITRSENRKLKKPKK